MSTEQRVAIVTGGGSGIGRATARRFAIDGVRVLVADIRESAGRETVGMIEAAGGIAAFEHTDVSRFPEVERAVECAVAHWGRVDIMFNNAGISISRPLLEHTPEDYEAVLRVNQYGVFNGILAAGRRLALQGTGGCIVNTVSVFAWSASVGLIAYHAAKAAVRAMTEAAALELAQHDIRVVGIAPGGVDTPLLDEYHNAGLTRRLAKRHMRGRLLTAEQIAEVVVFLASPAASAINGTTVLADDGFVAFK